MTDQQWINQLHSEGFINISMVKNDPNIDFGEHIHQQHTVHVLLDGELIITDEGDITTLKKGERFEFPAGTIHEAKSGPKGCTFLVAVKP